MTLSSKSSRRSTGAVGGPARACVRRLSSSRRVSKRASKERRGARPSGPVLDCPECVLRSCVRLGAGRRRQNARRGTLFKRTRTSSSTSHGGGGQYTCVIAIADKSTTPDQPQAVAQRLSEAWLQSSAARMSHRDGTPDGESLLGRKAAFVPAFQLWRWCTRETGAPSGNTHRARLYVNLLRKACNLEQHGAHADSVKQRICDLASAFTTFVSRCHRVRWRCAPRLELRRLTYVALLEGPNTGCRQLLRLRTPPGCTQTSVCG